jgi:uncharacterized protein GlcG (DUF336 family)
VSGDNTKNRDNPHLLRRGVGYRATGFIAASAFLLASCGGGGSPSPSPSPSPTPTPTPTGAAYTLPAADALSVTDVERVVAGAVAEAQARGVSAVIAVVDRPGNVLAVFRMNGAATTALTRAAPNGVNRDAQGATVPATAGAIAKAVTGAYLSSGGNAFSTRTASMIVQQRFPPAATAAGLESGPLYGVQFSQLPCSDLSRRYADGNVGTGPFAGPKRSPLGLSADPGGFPLYRNGVLIGGIGVMIDADYGFDTDVGNIDTDVEELVALGGTRGFEAGDAIRADRIPVDGTTLRYSDAAYGQLTSSAIPAFAAINGPVGALIPVRGYYGAPTPVVQAGVTYGTEASGLRLATATDFIRTDAMVLSDGAGVNRYPIRAGTDAASVASPLTAAESRAILEDAFTIMARARAQIRRPVDSQAQVTISLVDTHGAVLGMVRSPDAPVFGIDVSLQKARSAAFLSNTQAASDLLASSNADVRAAVPATRTFLNDANALIGGTAFSNRAIGNIHRPYFPDGELGRPAGPLSRDIAGFNPLSTGLQSALIGGNLVDHLLFLFNVNPTDVPVGCSALPGVGGGANRLPNGLQIFPGSVPVYRGTTLVGGIGVSGDGIDQDDMISFLGLANGATRIGGNLANAPLARRSDQVVVRLNDGRDVRLRWVGCPFTPFLDTTAQNVCQGL